MLQFKNTIEIFKKNCQTWKKRHLNDDPCFLTHSFSLREKLVIHLLTHSARYGAQFLLNCILQLRNISWLVDVHFSFEVPPQK